MNDFDSIIKRMTVTRLEPGDYTGEDGLLYCGKCRTPKQFRMDAPPLEGRLLPHPCRCEQERIDREAAEQEARRHRQAVAELKRWGFTDPAMKDWIFANDNGKCPQMKHARFYVENWSAMQEENIGYLLWGWRGDWQKLFCGLYRQCPDGTGSSRPHDQLCPDTERFDCQLRGPQRVHNPPLPRPAADTG